MSNVNSKNEKISTQTDEDVEDDLESHENNSNENKSKETDEKADGVETCSNQQTEDQENQAPNKTEDVAVDDHGRGEDKSEEGKSNDNTKYGEKEQGLNETQINPFSYPKPPSNLPEDDKPAFLFKPGVLEPIFRSEPLTSESNQRKTEEEPIGREAAIQPVEDDAFVDPADSQNDANQNDEVLVEHIDGGEHTARSGNLDIPGDENSRAIIVDLESSKLNVEDDIFIEFEMIEVTPKAKIEEVPENNQTHAVPPSPLLSNGGRPVVDDVVIIMEDREIPTPVTRPPAEEEELFTNQSDYLDFPLSEELEFDENHYNDNVDALDEDIFVLDLSDTSRDVQNDNDIGMENSESFCQPIVQRDSIMRNEDISNVEEDETLNNDLCEASTSGTNTAAITTDPDNDNDDAFLMMELADNHLQCPICMEVFIMATTINCGHTFCQDCIEDWKKQHKVCPYCRTKIKYMVTSTAIDQFITDMFGILDEEGLERRRQFVSERLEKRENTKKKKKK